MPGGCNCAVPVPYGINRKESSASTLALDSTSELALTSENPYEFSFYHVFFSITLSLSLSLSLSLNAMALKFLLPTLIVAESLRQGSAYTLARI